MFSKCTLNVIKNPLQVCWIERVLVMNGNKIEKIMNNLKIIFPPQENSFKNNLSTMFKKLEMDEYLAMSAPTYMHSLDQNRYLFTTPLHHEKIRKPNEEDIFPLVASLCQGIKRKSMLYDLRKNSPALEKLQNKEEKDRLIQLREKIQLKF